MSPPVPVRTVAAHSPGTLFTVRGSYRLVVRPLVFAGDPTIEPSLDFFKTKWVQPGELMVLVGSDVVLDGVGCDVWFIAGAFYASTSGSFLQRSEDEYLDAIS